LKEAETDAMKRALMTFGNPFGLALYDKTQENVVDGPSPAEVEAMAYVARCKTDLQQVETTDELREWWKAEAKNRQLHDFAKEDPLYQDLYRAMIARGEALSPPKVAAQ
jgi:DNA repair and recombination protein RAD52